MTTVYDVMECLRGEFLELPGLRLTVRALRDGSIRVSSAPEGPMAFVFQRNVGMLVLGVWLVLSGLSGFVSLGLPYPLMAGLALVAGVLILAGR
jgi:hypothetical protein